MLKKYTVSLIALAIVMTSLAGLPRTTLAQRPPDWVRLDPCDTIQSFFLVRTAIELPRPKKPKDALNKLEDDLRVVVEPVSMEFTDSVMNRVKLAKDALDRGNIFTVSKVLEDLNERIMAEILQLELMGNFPAASTLRGVVPELITTAIAELMAFIPLPAFDPEPCCPCTVRILVQMGGTQGDPGTKLLLKPGDIPNFTAQAKPHCPGPFLWEIEVPDGATGWGYASSESSAGFTAYNSGDIFTIKVTHNHGVCVCTDALDVVVQ